MGENVYQDLPVLETVRTVLRKISIRDDYDIFAYCSDEEVAKYTTWYAHASLEDSRGYIERILQRYSQQQVAPWGIQDKASGKLVGTCGFVGWDVHHAKAELGYAISRDFWGQGYMTEVVKRIIDLGLNQMDLVRIEARCHPDNVGSARVMEKSGMQFEGLLRKSIFTKGVHQDLKMYALVK
ncbi:GNAT family N-acetyltransferase [Paenibacillus sp. AR247]|uniref:GNAT family N-acetyltransferase n=1 Tax=Paenibacillus sp. AR247 TaxID=1631599 RepID=UPI000CFA4743|nr:GNAT family N-acetyltransferase [Paenibacillus sp. AR247]PQP85912.1 GNAT family N-acetyltransferase [Paenibacillus sp. AR247]